MCHFNEEGAGVIETAERTGEPSLPTTSHPLSYHSITLLHPYLVPSPPMTPLLSPYPLTPCGLPVFSLKPQSLISASLGQHSPFPHPVVLPTLGQAIGSPFLHRLEWALPIQDLQPKKRKCGMHSVIHQARLFPFTCRPHFRYLHSTSIR